MNSKQRRGCLWAAVGSIVAIVMIGGVIAVGGGWLIYQSVGFRSQAATPIEASQEFEQLRQRFAGQQPLLDVDADGSTRLRLRERAATSDVQSVHMVVWDPGQRRLVRFQVPFWLLQFSGDGDVRFSDGNADVPRVRLKVSDLQQAGPGLIVDHTHEGHRVLIWAE